MKSTNKDLPTMTSEKIVANIIYPVSTGTTNIATSKCRHRLIKLPIQNSFTLRLLLLFFLHIFNRLKIMTNTYNYKIISYLEINNYLNRITIIIF